VVVTAAAWLTPRPAAADTMDPALERFVIEPGCRSLGAGGGLFYNPGYHPSTSLLPAFCQAKNADFAKLIAQYGTVIAPTAMHSARTTGFGGFELALEADYTTIDNGADYWKRGTAGPQDPTSKNFSDINKSPPGVMQLYQAKLRKGFPFGLELTGSLGYLAQTSIFTIGADVRFSVLEGFRTGIPAIFPEITVGGSVRTITGTSEFQLTVAGFDAQISKPIPLGGTVILTPYGGYQWIRIFGDSGLVDFTPNTDPVALCGFTGINTPANPDGKSKYRDGTPVCAHGTGDDFNNTGVFNPVRLTKHRIDFGMQLRFQMVKLGVHAITDLVNPEDANKGKDYDVSTPILKPADPKNPGTTTENEFKGVAKQWTIAVDLGTVF
jgi:hypothetical protein